MSEHPLNKPETEVKVACLWCNNEMYFYYEGSHDWVFGCQKCCFEKGFYVPHLGDEKQEAVNKWFDWVRKVQSCSPVNPLESALTKSEERVKELERFVKSLLDPDDNGFAVNRYVRDEARKLFGIKPCETGEGSRALALFRANGNIGGIVWGEDMQDVDPSLDWVEVLITPITQALASEATKDGGESE